MAKVKYPAALLCDFYKIGHPDQYPDKTEYVFATWIPRTSRLAFADKVVAFGFQAFIKEYLIDYFNDNFFSRPVDEVAAEYSRYLKHSLFIPEPNTSRIRSLHALGYLPLKIKAVPEGTLVPLRVPMLTVENTHPEFGWVTNYIETLASCSLWQASTSATIALEYKRILSKYAKETSDIAEFVDYQGHDFSMRGMGALQSAASSGAGHLLSFVGTDTIPAIAWLEFYYNANIEKERVGCSVFATEHAVQCAGGKENEFETYRRLIQDVYPSGFISIVSDTWDLWHVVTDTLPKLKDIIMARDGRVVIRPDSGDPVDILCGSMAWDTKNYLPFDKWKAKCGTDGYTEDNRTVEEKGLIELLWDIFGGTVNSKGYKQLDPHIGAIYGDAITVDRAEEICARLKAKGFASTNIVLGIGSYTYQYNTRDTFGFAMKSTHCVIDGKEVNIFKDPATDTDKIKKSLTGRCVVSDSVKGLIAIDGLSIAEELAFTTNELRTIFCDGKLLIDDSLANIRARIL